MPADIKDVLQSIKDGIMDLAKNSFKDYAQHAEQDAQGIYDALKGDIERWAVDVAAGNLSAEDLQFLVNGKKDLMKVSALTQMGAAKIELDKFKQGVVNLIFSAIVKVIK